MFETKGARKIRGYKKGGSSRGLELYLSRSTFWLIESRKMGWTGPVTHKGEKRNAYRILAGKPEGKRSLIRPRRKCEFSISVDVKDMQ
jgi:hypothetical protein